MSTKVLASPLATTATGTMTRARIRVLPGTASPYERFVFHIANVFEELGTDGATLVKLLKFCEPVGGKTVWRKRRRRLRLIRSRAAPLTLALRLRTCPPLTRHVILYTHYALTPHTCTHV